MSNEEDAPGAAASLSKTRLEAFSDGVFAIATTLLVLDIALHPPGESAQAGARSVALLPRVSRQLPHDRRRVARPHRADRSARSGRRDPVATQPARPARRGLPAVPDAARRRSAPRRQRRAGVRHDVRAHTARHSHLRVRPRRIRTSRASLRRQRRSRNPSNPGEATWRSWRSTWSRSSSVSSRRPSPWRSTSASPSISSCHFERSDACCELSAPLPHV